MEPQVDTISTACKWCKCKFKVILLDAKLYNFKVSTLQIDPRITFLNFWYISCVIFCSVIPVAWCQTKMDLISFPEQGHLSFTWRKIISYCLISVKTNFSWVAPINCFDTCPDVEMKKKKKRENKQLRFTCNWESLPLYNAYIETGDARL